LSFENIVAIPAEDRASKRTHLIFILNQQHRPLCRRSSMSGTGGVGWALRRFGARSRRPLTAPEP
jgi:hypothetical protein